MRSSQSFTVGVLAKRAQVSPHTILYYERRGLLPRARRSIGGYRLFSSEALAQINFIKRAQKLSFSLGEIKDLLALHANPRATCSDVGERITAKIDDLDATLRALREARRVLARLAAQYQSRRLLSANPLLEQLEGLGADERSASVSRPSHSRRRDEAVKHVLTRKGISHKEHKVE